MVKEKNKDLSIKRINLPPENDILSQVQQFLDHNIRIVKNVSWIVGGIGIVIIIKRTYAFHHFTNHSKIPPAYFSNNTKLSGRVINVDPDGVLGVQHIPLLWRARLRWISEPSSKLLSVKITGIELQTGGLEYLSSLIKDNNVTFQLLGKDSCGNIESILYKKKGWFRQICVNEDILWAGFAVANHVESLSNVKAYNMLIERLVKAETKAVKKRTGIWKQERGSQVHNVFYRTWFWIKSMLFKL